MCNNNLANLVHERQKLMSLILERTRSNSIVWVNAHHEEPGRFVSHIGDDVFLILSKSRITKSIEQYIFKLDVGDNTCVMLDEYLDEENDQIRTLYTHVENVSVVDSEISLIEKVMGRIRDL